MKRISPLNRSDSNIAKVGILLIEGATGHDDPAYNEQFMLTSRGEGDCQIDVSTVIINKFIVDTPVTIYETIVFDKCLLAVDLEDGTVPCVWSYSEDAAKIAHESAVEVVDARLEALVSKRLGH